MKNELLYVEPMFIHSQQNPATQLKKVVVYFRGMVKMADTLDEAIEKAYTAYKVKINTLSQK